MPKKTEPSYPDLFPGEPAYAQYPPYPIPQPPLPVPAFAYAPAQITEEKMDPWQHANAQLLQDRNATVAKVTLVQRSGYNGPADFEFTATGSSKREQGDKFNARTGELMSLSRAYLKLSRQLMSAARELVEPEPAPEYVPPEDAWGAAIENGEVGVYAAEPDEVLEDPTDEDVELANEILAARAAFNAAVIANGEAVEEDAPDPRVVTAVEAFNGAADALNNAVTFLKALTD